MIGLRYGVYMYTCMWNISHKSKIVLFAATRMDLENIVLSELSQRKTDVISLACGI